MSVNTLSRLGVQAVFAEAEEPILLSLEDMLPDDYAHPAPDDLRVEMFWDSRPTWQPMDMSFQTAALLAWEQNHISAFEAVKMLEAHDLLDHDAVCDLLLAHMRAQAELV